MHPMMIFHPSQTSSIYSDEHAQSRGNRYGYYVGAKDHVSFASMCADGALHFAKLSDITAADVEAANKAAERAVHHAELARVFIERHLAARDAAASTVDAATADVVITGANDQANIAKKHALAARQRVDAINAAV
jgi:hypothetical protein